MFRFEVIELVVLGLSLMAIIPLMGKYMALIFEGSPPFFIRWLKWLENLIYRFAGIDPSQEMNWTTYAKALLCFNFIGFLIVFLLQMGQGWLPLNPAEFSNVEWPVALNTAISFATNTGWQSYAGENSLSYLTQSTGLTVQNFLSAATGNAVLIALIRGIKRQTTPLIGNFWIDLTRSIVYILLPLSVILALFLVSQGVIQNFHPYQEVTMWENEMPQIIPQGPIATQEAIKQLGSNGGGFFNANSTHPFENPTPFSNFVELIAIICLPASLVYMYGLMIGFKRQGLVILFVMLGLWTISTTIALHNENKPNLAFAHNPVMEGKETRIGITNSVLWAVTTTAISNGSTNSMHDSLSPLAGGVALFQMMLNGVIFGGVGSGLCNFMMFMFLSVFLAGLMVGRTPEYLGKKIEKNEIQLVMIAILIPSALTLIGTCITLSIPSTLNDLGNQGPHGLTEILYTFSSTSGGNGSGFEGFHAKGLYYQLTLAAIMLTSRLAILIPSLAIAGSLAQKKLIAASLGTFKTDTPLFGVLLVSVILIIGGLAFFPALALGPIIEQLLMQKGQTF